MDDNVIIDATHQQTQSSQSMDAADASAAKTESQKTPFKNGENNTRPLFARDTIYAQYFSAAPQFCFDAHVAAVFPDMIRRSVPGYGTALELIPAIAAQCLKPGDRVYDLGCSVGAGLLSVRQAISQFKLYCADNCADNNDNTPKPIHLIGIDTSSEMLERAQILFDTLKPQSQEPQAQYIAQFLQSDITQIAFAPTKLALLNYTLQFLPLAARDKLIEDVFQALVPGGCLMLSEKVVNPDTPSEQHLTKLHESFKRSQGYSALEVARKREALENVLVREQAADHINRLKKAGFSRVTPLMQCLQFTTFLAEK